MGHPACPREAHTASSPPHKMGAKVTSRACSVHLPGMLPLIICLLPQQLLGRKRMAGERPGWCGRLGQERQLRRSLLGDGGCEHQIPQALQRCTVLGRVCRGGEGRRMSTAGLQSFLGPKIWTLSSIVVVCICGQES